MVKGKNTVLVVEDEPDERRFLATVLEDGGFRTLQVEDGREAIRLIETTPPDLVTLDISMPEKSGVGVYRFVKESERFRNLPVIIVTGVTKDFRRFISTRRQVPPPDGYLSKPVDPDELLQTVRELIGGPLQS
jgi:CheY-like chemotaxis protein